MAHSDRMLEILAGVSTCQDQDFSVLEHLVLDHAAAVSGCICVLLAWDDQRQNFVRKLKVFGVPLLVLVVVGEGETQKWRAGVMEDDPARFHVLEAGRIEEGLAKLK